MAASYPGAIKVFTPKISNDTIQPAHINDLQDEVAAIETDILSSGLTLTSGKIAFPATQSASANANTLDDYEEGTFTPTLVSSGGGTPTYTTQGGQCVKVGQMVWFGVSLTLATKGTLAAGTLTLAGLPFTIANSSLNFGGVSIPAFANLATSVASMGAYSVPNTSTLQLTYVAAGGGTSVANLAVSDINNTFSIFVGGVYRASQ
jgi:hypothetical protein